MERSARILGPKVDLGTILLIGQRCSGHFISEAGVAIDPIKIVDTKEWRRPKTPESLRHFLRHMRYYHRFVKDFAIIANPLLQMLRKDSTFAWNPLTEKAFKSIKEAISNAPVLAHPDYGTKKPFVVECDVSSCGIGIGAVLMQELRPIAFYSRVLPDTQQLYSRDDKEIRALVHAVHNWHSYLRDRQFVVQTDSQSGLKHLWDQRKGVASVYHMSSANIIATTNQRRWLAKLMEYDFVIECKSLNRENVDAPARLKEERRELVTVVSDPVIPKCVEAVEGESVEKLVENVWKGKALLYGLNEMSSPSLKNDVLRHFHQCYLHECRREYQLRNDYKRAREYFFWKGMWVDFREYIRNCNECQRLQPKLPVLDHQVVWEDIAIALIDDLPLSQTDPFVEWWEVKTAIFVVVDRKSKYAHFVGVRPHYSATTIARSFYDHVFKLHGMPKTIVWDYDDMIDKSFTSLFWTELFRLNGGAIGSSSADHSLQTADEESKLFNRTLEMYLRSFACRRKWLYWLRWAEFCYNTTRWSHSETEKTPYEVVYGRAPPPLPTYIKGAEKDTGLKTRLLDRNRMFKKLKKDINEIQAQMRHIYDSKSTDSAFSLEDNRIYDSQSSSTAKAT